MTHEKKTDVPPALTNMLTMAMTGIDEEFILGIARSNPDFLLGIMKSMNPDEIVQAVNANKEFFIKIARQLPSGILGRLIREQPELVAKLVEDTDRDLIFGVAGSDGQNG